MDTILASTVGRHHDYDAPFVKLLDEAGFKVRFSSNPNFSNGICSVEEAISELEGVSAVIAWGDSYPRDLLESLDGLRVIARAGVGFDKVDIKAATGCDIVVTVTPTANHAAVAEHAIALIFAVARKIIWSDKSVRKGEWATVSMVPLRGSTLGIVGLGRIGRDVAVRALGLDMRVIANEKFPDKEFVAEYGIELVEMDELLGQSDFITLHCPLAEETQGLINRGSLEMMKTGAFLINTARGGLVVEEDLIEALRLEKIAGAGLDVLEIEPANRNNPIFELDNVVLSPHHAGSDKLAVENMGIEAAQCIISLSRGEWPEKAVINSELGGNWQW
ncbi:MAG: Hydroxypyruvate reductase [Candidatus Moanabacter tarae]|uniref:Hydroxypyruvate reductase n=1 Tax=Candidatus Moanibacter tarae TaxID=2200854 RepID=A0A2Z4AE69_9BACT|nr:MAG: Hydroxypyruvate reductase [Candidatus Moanabacter tarae]|tara:strand:+ start:37629 stop:38627 length:999 start_codon:yes stop_codon:yes gene_type:complete